MSLCPCGLNEEYENCCAPYHQGQAYPENAERLMRSRYAAYVKHNIPYVVTTTVPAQQELLDQPAMLKWSQDTQWVKLEVLKFMPKVSKIHAQVEFKAYYQIDQQSAQNIEFHHELSTFTLIDGKWYFLDPTVESKTTMKQPCICGSGKKFKQCCATFLG